MKTETGIGVTQPQDKKRQQPPEVGREQSFRASGGSIAPKDTLILTQAGLSQASLISKTVRE